MKFDRCNTTDISPEQRLRNAVNDVVPNDANKIRVQGLIDNLMKDITGTSVSPNTQGTGATSTPVSPIVSTPTPTVHIFHPDRILQLIRSDINSVVSDLKLIEFDRVVGEFGTPKVKFNKQLKEFITSKDKSSSCSVFHSIVALRLVHEIASLDAFHVSQDAKSQRDSEYKKGSYTLHKGFTKSLARLRSNRVYHKPLQKFLSCLHKCHNNDYVQFSNANKHFRIRTLKQYQSIKSVELCQKCLQIM